MKKNKIHKIGFIFTTYLLILFYILTPLLLGVSIFVKANTVEPTTEIQPTPTADPSLMPLPTQNEPTPTYIPTQTPAPTIPEQAVPTNTPTATPTLTPTNTPIPTNIPSPTIIAAETFHPRVYIVNFNPQLTTQNNLKLIDYMNWTDPNVIAQNFISQMKEVSYHLLNYQIVGRIDADDIPLKQDGFKYTEEEYLACAKNTGPCHNQTPGADFANYAKIIADYHICDLVNTDQIDELWLFGGPWFGFYEANMAGPGGVRTNGPVINNTSCTKAFHIMGHNYERGDTMLESYGHRAEGLLNQYLGSKVNSSGYGWSQFTTNIGRNPSLSVFGCGSVHYPPNAYSDYQDWNKNYVNSNCDDWLNYPDFTNKAESINCDAWNCEPSEYLMWWFKHFPHIGGKDNNGDYNSWWSYIVNSTPSSTDTPRPTIIVNPFLPPESSTPMPTPTPTVTPIPTLVISPSKTRVSTYISKNFSNPSGLTMVNGFQISASENVGWQLKVNNDAKYMPFGGSMVKTIVQGFGFYESSGGLVKGQKILIHAFTNNNKPLGTYFGSYTLQQIYKGVTKDVAKITYKIVVREKNPILPAPANLLPSGIISAGERNITWDKVEGATAYVVRVDREFPSFAASKCATVNPGDYCNLSYSGTSLNFNFEAGHTYRVWVYAENKSNPYNETTYGKTAAVNVTVK